MFNCLTTHWTCSVFVELAFFYLPTNPTLSNVGFHCKQSAWWSCSVYIYTYSTTESRHSDNKKALVEYNPLSGEVEQTLYRTRKMFQKGFKIRIHSESSEQSQSKSTFRRLTFWFRSIRKSTQVKTGHWGVLQNSAGLVAWICKSNQSINQSIIEIIDIWQANRKLCRSCSAVVQYIAFCISVVLEAKI